MDTPVGISSAAPAARVSGVSMQARKSMPADPAVACCGKGNSRPMRGSRIRSLMVRGMAMSLSISPGGGGGGLASRAARPHAVTRQGSGPALARTAPGAAVGRRQALGDQCDELARDIDFRPAGDFHFAGGPNDGECVVVAIEGDPFANLVGGDHIELLALGLAARILFDVVG